VRIETVQLNPLTEQYSVQLQDVADAQRHLCIWIGKFEALAIVAHLEQIPMPRPPTYAFLANVLRAGSLTLQEARIIRLTDDVFYATAILDGPAGTVEVDARPSDVLALASLTGARIRAADELLSAEAPSPAPEP